MLTRLAAIGAVLALMLASGCRSSAEAPPAPVGPTKQVAGPASGSNPPEAAEPTAVPPTLVPPTATPAGPELQRLTEPGCCPLPFWSADGRTVLFWYGGDDSDGGGTGVYGAPVEGGTPERFGDYAEGVHLAGRFATHREGDEIVLTRTADGESWRLDTGGEPLVVAPEGARVAWVEELGRFVPGGAPPPLRHWIADLASGERTEVTIPAHYALADWLADDAWLLSMNDRRQDLPGLVWLDLATGEQREVFDGARLRTGRTSPDRRWLAITRSYEEDPAANGLFILATDGTVPPRALDLVGGYRWRDEGRLLVVPMQPGASSMELWQIEAATGNASRITEPATTPFRIAAGEWSVSPGGTHVAYRSADDDAIWVMRLPAD